MDGRLIGFDELPQIVRTEDARAVYLIDIDTDEIIYMNKYAKEMLQRPVDDESYHGCKCYTVLQGLDERCKFCHNASLQTENFFVEEVYQPYIQRYLEVKSILLEHNGPAACGLKCCIICRRMNWNGRSNMWKKNYCICAGPIL